MLLQKQGRLFFLISWLLLALHVGLFATPRQFESPGLAAWTLAATLTYAFFYLLPALALGQLALRLAQRRPSAGAQRFLALTLIGLTGLTQTLIFADRVIYKMYGFHINGFVIDLVLTPGGIDSLGASLSTQLTAAAIVTGFFALQALVYFYLVPRLAGREHALTRLKLRWLILLLIVPLSLGERLAYAYSSAANHRPILFASERYPLYLPLTARKVAKRLGIEEAPREEGIAVRDGSLSYPLTPLRIEPPKKPLNVVWLVAESLRFDMLDPKIMPQLWRFSENAARFENHYSGGNLTQMGVFSMFYGLYSTYWFPVLANRRAPLLLDTLQAQNYQFGLYTSQRFTFPPFDKTVFVNMNRADMHERSGGAEAWQRDRQNVADIIDFIDRRDPARPFMTYMFFESTHANYYFPPELAIARPYLDDLNYLTADFRAEIDKIKNRYINASHHVDQQVGRLLDHLREKKLLDSTIVLVVGDHGEEFMERSRWGHSAEFNRFQTSTPAVLHVPGDSPRVVRSLSSHLDLPATLMPLFGVTNPASDYSLGHDLRAPDFKRDYAVAGDWNRLAYIGDELRIAFPVNATGAARNEAFDGDDRPLDDVNAAKARIQPALLEIMQHLGRFLER